MALYLVFNDELRPPKQDYTDLQDASVTLRHSDEDGNIAYSFSGDVEFTGEARNYIYNNLLKDKKGTLGGVGCEHIKVKVYDDCCQNVDTDTGEVEDYLIFEGQIRGDGIDFCDEECPVKAPFEADDDQKKIVTCLKSARISDNSLTIYDGGRRFKQIRHPFIRYCNAFSPRFMLDLWMIIGISIYPIVMALMWIMIPFIIAMNLVIEFLNALGANINESWNQTAGDDSFGVESFYDLFINQFNEFITGCGYGHTAPYVRDYVTNACNKCNLKFKSSILNEPDSLYYNLVQLDASVNKGFRKYVNWNEDNAPFDHLSRYLEFLSKVFNGGFRIEGTDTLRFERRDYFISNQVWLDLSDGVKRGENGTKSICYRYLTKKPPAMGHFKYMKDSIDGAGNEAFNYYRDRMDFDDPYGTYPCFEGELEKTLPISPPQFRHDGIAKDKLTWWRKNYYIAFAIMGPLALFAIPLKKHLDDGDNDYNLLLTAGTCSDPKLLIHDVGSGIKVGKVVKYKPTDLLEIPGQFYHPEQNYIVTSDGSEFGPDAQDDLQGTVQDTGRYVPNFWADDDDEFKDYLFQPQMWVSAPLPQSAALSNYENVPRNKPHVERNLYTEFWIIEDPRVTNTRNLEYTAEVLKECKFLRELDFLKSVKLPNGLMGTIEEVVIKEDTLKIKGFVYAIEDSTGGND